MAQVIFVGDAAEEFEAAPLPIQNRITDIIGRLEKWPDVSGAKPLRGNLAGSHRIRTGDYRVVFTVSSDGQTVSIWKIGHRGGVYD